jgi:hypothetical protein
MEGAVLPAVPQVLNGPWRIVNETLLGIPEMMNWYTNQDPDYAG